MAATKYDFFIAPQQDRGDFSYTTNNPSVQYPDSNQINVFGPVYLPRVYGKDLTSFEIASSGSVAITLNDIHSFDMIRDNTDSNITLKTLSNDKFILTAGINSNVFINMDAPQSNLTLAASNTINFVSSNIAYQLTNDFSVQAEDIYLIAQKSLQGAGVTGDILFAASNSNITFQMTQNDARLYASHDVLSTAGNDVAITAASDVTLAATTGSMLFSASNSNVTLALANNNATLVASDTIVLDGNFLSARGATSVGVYGGASVYMAAQNSNVTFSMAEDKATLFATSDILATASNDLLLTAQSDVVATAKTGSMLFSASNDRVTLALADDKAALFATSDILATTSNDLLLTAQSDIFATAVTGAVMVSASNGQATFALKDQDASLYALKDVLVTASNNLSAAAQKNVYLTAATEAMELKAASQNVQVKLQADSTLSLTASNQIYAAALNAVQLTSLSNSVELEASNKNVFVHLTNTSNLNMYAAKDVTVTADERLLITTLNAAVLNAGNSITMNTANSMTIASSNAYSVTASNDVTMEALVGSLNLKAAGGKAFATFDAATTTLSIGTSNNIFTSASNDIALTAHHDGAFTAYRNLELSGFSNAAFKTSAGNKIAVEEASNTITMTAGARDIITVYSDRVKIDGNIQVVGTIDSIDITQTNLAVMDKTINLAYDSNDQAVPDGIANSGAGILIAGTYGADSNARSLTWNWGNGMDKLGTADADGESFWDVRGGSLRISHSNATKQVAFGFRINDLDELELVKKTASGAFKRIAKFGRTLL